MFLNRKWFLLCNDIPAFPSDDDGTWRRVRIINFPSKFVDEHTFSNRKYEFMIDPSVEDKLSNLKDAFMWLLIQYYNKFKELMRNGGLKEPKEVLSSTNRERKRRIIRLNNLLIVELKLLIVKKIKLHYINLIMLFVNI